jgi:HK97 family phage major capsid protein
MKRLKFLLEERARIAGEMNAIMAKCETENRSRTTDEKTKWQALKVEADSMEDEIRDLQAQEEVDRRSAKPVGNPPAEKQDATKIENAKPLSLRSQIQKWMDENKTDVDAILRGEKRDLKPMELRADDPMTIGTVNSGSSVFLPNAGRAPGGVVDLVRTQPTFWNLLTKGSTKLNPLYWVNKSNKQGNADFIGEGVLKPLASIDLTVETSTAKKVAERMRVSQELLHDVDGFQSMIQNELAFEVLKHANDAALTATASSTDIAGITTLASAFSLTTIEAGGTPSYSDAIRAAIAQLQSLNFNDNIVAFVNPIDAANMDLAKSDDDGHYLLPPFVSQGGLLIAGVRVVVDNNIAVGNLLIGDMTKYKILMVEEFKIMWGLDMDDFSKNLITVIGEMRFHQYFSANHTGAFIYDSFADIVAAITTT